MEKNATANSTRNSKDKEKKPWMYSQLRRGGFTWPSRTYCCSFCRREFKSAQALGGHMNVHRRDKARLRQSPPSNPKLGSKAVPCSNDAFSSMISPSIHLLLTTSGLKR
ncbi:hypothetical protein C4D60_Mb02t12640 [Musa balbisiana]|uniref:C2H2-type domain-containing protein n=1 Tax=Musa balbisiana TaxID=52838 RepID=A0A4S8IA74_MUSBA|nr:hypothetical protein C4D60_Mb02t12640 [Musa balbisiana]